MASDSVIRCFGSVKSPFPAASASDAASNSFRCTNLPRKLRKRSRPFLGCKNTKNSSLPDNPSCQSNPLARHKNHFRNAPPILTHTPPVETGLAPSCRHHRTRGRKRGEPRLYGKACYAFAVIVSSPWPCGPVSRIRSKMAKVSPTNPRIEKIHMPSPYPPGLSSPAWA